MKGSKNTPGGAQGNQMPGIRCRLDVCKAGARPTDCVSGPRAPISVWFLFFPPRVFSFAIENPCCGMRAPLKFSLLPEGYLRYSQFLLELFGLSFISYLRFSDPTEPLSDISLLTFAFSLSIFFHFYL